MALINCPKCGKRVSDKAIKCPRCGKILRRNKKRNFWIIISLVCMVLFSIGTVVGVIKFKEKTSKNKIEEQIDTDYYSLENSDDEATEIVTEITIKDLNGYNGNSYIDGVTNQYAIVGYQGSFAKNISYDSNVIKNIEIDTGDVNTMIPGNYPLTFKITIDVDEFCKKENKQNGIVGDTITINYDSSISIIDKEYAEEIIRGGVEKEDILGYK